MWHLIAPIVRWPLHSPWRLVGIVATFLVAVFVAGEMNGDDAAPAAEPSPSVSADATGTYGAPSTSPTPLPTGSSSPSSTSTATDTGVADDGATDALSADPADDNPSMAAANAAAAFVTAWARPDLDTKEWAGAVQPLSTPEFWSDGLAATDPANTPDVTVAGEPVQVAINVEEGVFDVPTSGEWIRVHVAYNPDDKTWRASSVESVA